MFEPNTKYELSFEYEILSSTTDKVFTYIGYGEKSFAKTCTSKPKDYKVHLSQKQGVIKHTFVTENSFAIEKPELRIRFAATNYAESFEVEFYNIKFKKIK